MREVAIAGVAMTPFKLYDGNKGRPFKQFYELGEEAVIEVLKNADMEFKDIQAAFGGSVFCGVATTHQCLKRVGSYGIPIVNVENACSTSTSALRLAYQSVATGLYDVVLAMGVEKMPRGLIENPAVPVWQRMLGIDVVPAIVSTGITKYMADYSATEEDFARIVVMERKHANIYPNAFFYGKGEVTIEEVLNSPMYVSPLRFLMMCPNGDGASAAIVCTKDRLKSKDKVVTIAAAVLATDPYSTMQPTSVRVQNPSMFELAVKQAWEASGLGPEDIDVLQAHEPFAPIMAIDLEGMGFAKPGEFPHLMKEGYFDIGGKLPVNTDGGMIGRSHPLGASGIAQVYEIYHQLRDEADSRQVARAKCGLVQNAGAGESCVVVILKR